MRCCRIGFNLQVTFSNGRAGCTRIRRSSGSLFIGGKVTVAGDGLSASFTPGTGLEAETGYCFYVTGVVDLVGQPLVQNGQTLGCFTTGANTQTTGPAVLAVSPPDGAQRSAAECGGADAGQCAGEHGERGHPGRLW